MIIKFLSQYKTYTSYKTSYSLISIIKKIVFLILFMTCTMYSANGPSFIHNPFKNNYGSLLNYNRFSMFNQITFLSLHSKNNSQSYGYYLNTIGYDINKSVTAYAHLGKKLNFQKKESMKFKNKQDYLKGGSVVYKPGNDFTFGASYGTTPVSLNCMSYGRDPFYSSPFLHSSYHPNINTDKNVNIWLNKGFSKNRINLSIQFQQVEYLQECK